MIVVRDTLISLGVVALIVAVMLGPPIVDGLVVASLLGGLTAKRGPRV